MRDILQYDRISVLFRSRQLLHISIPLPDKQQKTGPGIMPEPVVFPFNPEKGR